MRTKVTKERFDFIKVSLNQIGITDGTLIHDLEISISTLNKIKRCKDFEEYKYGKDIKSEQFNSNDTLYLISESAIDWRFEEPKPKFSILRTIKNLLHLK